MGVGKKMFMKTTWYPREHDEQLSWNLSAENNNNKATTIPIITNSDAEDPTSIYTHPENASFSSVDHANCSPDSRVNRIWCVLEANLTKGAIETDKIKALRFGVMVQKMSFAEDYDTTDEVTGTDIKTILKLSKDGTDRETYPTYDGNDVSAKYTGSS